MRSAIAIFLALTLVGCTQAPPPPPLKTYQLTGTVVSLSPQDKLVKVQHEKIEGWMEAMTMEFPVRDGSEFARLAPGQRIQATVNVQDIDYWLTAIQVVTPPPQKQ